MPGTIEITNFAKYFDGVTAVDNISLTVESGELFGLIGPDGAGKTTTMRTLCTLLRLEKGDIRVDGRDVRKEISGIRAILGYMPQRFSLYPDLSVAENLNFFADLFGVGASQKEEQLERLYRFSKLGPYAERKANALSGGMKQKLALSCTLIHTPRILILDEPTTGVDPVSRREFWDILRRLRNDGTTILVSTPYMDEADLCDRVAFMFNGQILACDQPQKLPDHFPHHLYEIHGPDVHLLANYFREETSAFAAHIFGGHLHVSFAERLSSEDIASYRRQVPVDITSFEATKPGIEDTFLALMRKTGDQP